MRQDLFLWQDCHDNQDYHYNKTLSVLAFSCPDFVARTVVGSNMPYSVYHRFPKQIHIFNLLGQNVNLFNFQIISLLPLK